jgi:hypothetical protein
MYTEEVLKHFKNIVKEVVEKYKDYQWERRFLCKIV